jgi:molecular chaperone GrpE (heat shock protein)
MSRTASRRDPFAEAMKQAFANERRERNALEREVASLRQDLAMLKAEFDNARRTDEIVARLDGGQRAVPLRSVIG